MAEAKIANSEGKPKGQLDARTLKQASEFTIIFNDGKGLKAKLIDVDNYNLLIEAAGQKLLVPKHSVKYINLRR